MITDHRMVLVLASVVAVCGCAQPSPPPDTSSTPPSLAQVENLTFAGVYDEPVALRSGVYEGTPFEPGGELRPRLELVEDSFLTADLDGDGNDEAAVLLSESSGGSGVFTYLAIAATDGEQVRNIATTELGDRVMVKSMEATEDGLVMELIVAGLDDPACCPTAKVRNTYRLDGERLTVKSEELGRLSVADLGGATWRLSHWGWSDPVEPDVEITIAFEKARAAGKSACNQYQADVRSREGAELSFGPIAATKKACPEPLDGAEHRYFGALGAVQQFSFSLGRLALSYQEGEDFKTLLFERDEPTP